MSEFDDPVLRNALEQLAGYPPDQAAALAEVRQRGRTVRQRRAAVLTLACAGVLGIAVYGAGRQRPAQVTVIDAAGLSEVTAAPATTTTSATTSAVATLPAPTTTVGGLLIEPVSGQQPELGTIPTTVAVTQPASGPASGTASSGTRAPSASPPSGTSPPSGETAPPPPAPTSVGRQTDSYSSGGGSLSVSTDGSTVTLVSAVAGDGFTAEIDKSSGSSVRVNFVGKKTTFRVKAKLDGGRIVFEVQKDDDQETTSTDPTDLGDSESGVGNGSSDSGGDYGGGYGGVGDHGLGGDG